MVFKVDNPLYYGSDAIYALSPTSSPSGVFNRINRRSSRSNTRVEIAIFSALFLPQRAFEDLAKAKINNLGLPHNNRF
jgi:hypothetical protein